MMPIVPEYEDKPVIPSEINPGAIVPEAGVYEYKEPDVSDIDVSGIPDVSDIDLSAVPVRKPEPQETPDYSGDMDKRIKLFTIGHGPVKPEYVRDLIAMNQATGIHPDLLHENKDQIPLIMREAKRPDEVYTNQNERRAYIPDWQKAEEGMFADKTKKSDVHHAFDVMSTYGKYRDGANGYLGLQGAWDAEAISQLDRYALPKELYVLPSELKRSLGEKTPKFVKTLGISDRAWKMAEKGNLPLPMHASRLMNGDARAYFDKLKDISYANAKDIPAPVMSWERAGGAIVKGAEQITKDKLIGIKSELEAIANSDEGVIDLNSPQDLMFPTTAYGKQGISPGYDREKSKEQYLAAAKFMGELAEKIEIDPAYAQSSGFLEDLLTQTPQIAEQVLTVLAVRGGARFLPKASALQQVVSKVGPALASGTVMYHEILGSTYQKLVDSGVQPERAFAAGMLDAITQTPLEQLSLAKIMKGFKADKGLVKRGLAVLESMLTEGGTEAVQSYTGKVAETWGEGADQTAGDMLAKYIKELPDTSRQALYEGAIGAVLGGAMTGIGQLGASVVHRRMDAKEFDVVLKGVEARLKEIAPEVYEQIRAKGTEAGGKPGEAKPSPRAKDVTATEPLTSMDEDGRSKAPVGYQIPEGRTVEQETALVMAAMAHVESGGNYRIKDKTGGSGYGKYQFEPGTWEDYSKEYTQTLYQEERVLPMTPANQDAVTEFKVSQWLEKGYSPKQIAAMWNSGKGNPDWYGRVGVNKKTGARYDVPGHVAKVDRAYQAISQGKPVPVGRADVAHAVGKAKGITPEQVDKVMTVMDAAAGSWAETYGKTTDEWYSETFAGFGDVGSEGFAQYVGKNAKGFKEALATGKVFEGRYDKMQRFEISDMNMQIETPPNLTRVRPSGKQTLLMGTMGQAVKHDVLYENYPEIRDVGLSILFDPELKNSRGTFEGNTIQIRAKNSYEAHDVLAHEIQHWIQKREGFAKGGDPIEFAKEYQAKIGELNKKLAEVHERMGKPWNPEWDKWKEERDRILGEIKELGSMEGTEAMDKAYNKYRMLAGEIEARDTASRLMLDDYMRGQYPPYSLENIPAEDATVVFQGENVRKGAVKFLKDGKAILALFEGADVSTVIHELGHILRRQLSEADMKVVEDAFGVKSGKWEKTSEEKFARAFERYVMEGKAPSWKLRTVFAKLKKWMTDIYQTVSTLDVEINDDVRQVFDRLLTTEAQRNADVLYQMDDDYSWVEPAAEEIPVGDITEYEQVQAEAARRAHSVVERLIEKNRLKREAGLRKEALAMLEEEPIWQFLKHVRKYKGVNIESVRANFGSDTIRMLTRKYPGLLTKEGKIQLDILASEFGYAGDDALIEALTEFPGKNGYVEQAMNGLREETKDYSEESDIAEWQERYITEEIKILGEILGKSTKDWENVPRKGIKKFINDEMGKTKVGDALTGKEDSEYKSLVAAMKMASRNAAIAFREGKKDAALTAKLNQREISERLKAKVKAKQEVRKIQADFKKWLKDKSIESGYKDQLAALVAPYDLKRQRPSQKLESLREFIARKEAEGESVDIPQNLVEQLSKKPIGTLTLDELRELHAVAEQIVHLGKLKNKLIDRKKARDFNAVLAKVIGTIVNKARTVKELPDKPRTPSERRQGDSYLSRMFEKLDTWHTQLLQVEFLIRGFDGFEDMGPCYQELFLPIKAAEDEKLALVNAVTSKWEEIRQPLAKQMRTWSKDRVEVPGLNRMLTREEHIMIAMNARHPDNRTALVAGNKFTEAEINAVENSLTDEERTFIDRVINELIPIPKQLLQDTYKQLNGRPLKMVEGDYVPMKFDPVESNFIEEKRAEADAMNYLKDFFRNPYMEKGMTVERKGGKQPLLLSFSAIFEHLSDTAQYATHGLPVRNLLKVFSHRAFSDAVKVTHGDAVYKQLKPWLKEVASPGARPLMPLEGVIGTIRRHSVLFILGYRFSTAIQQPGAIFQTMDEIGVGTTVSAMNRYLFGKAENGQTWHDFVMSKSVALQNRAQSFDRDLAEAIGEFDPTKSEWKRGYEKAAFAMTAFMDGVAARMSWLAAYQKAIRGEVANIAMGNEDGAVDYADGVVSRTQASGRPKNLAAVMRGGEVHKMFLTFFMSFFNTMHNRLWESYQKLRLPGYEYNALDMMKSMMLLVILPAIISDAASKGEPPEDKKAVAGSIARYMVSGVPLVRDALSVVSGYQYRGGLIGGVMNEVGMLGSALTSDKANGKVWNVIKHTLKLGGYMTGMPPDQALIILESALDPKNKKWTPDDLIWRERNEKKK